MASYSLRAQATSGAAGHSEASEVINVYLTDQVGLYDGVDRENMKPRAIAGVYRLGLMG